MSEPRVAPDQQQRCTELLHQIGATLIGAAPPAWRRLDLIARVVVGAQDVGLTVIMSDFSCAQVEPPQHLARAFAELREVMYVSERGAWRSARYTLDPPGAFQVFYDYDHDPRWNRRCPTP
jgi:hypothetical protein